MKLWWQSTVDYARHPSFVAALERHASRVASAGTTLTFHGMDADLGHGLPQADVILSPAVFTSVVVPLFMRNLRKAQQQGCDAFIIGTFAEPALRELRSLADIPVVSAFEASVLAGCSVAPRIALVTLSEQTVPYLEASIERHRLATRISGIRLVDREMVETSLDEQFAAPEPYLERFRAAARLAIADGADAVIPAEGVVATIVGITGLREIDAVPVIDAVGVSILAAEHAVILKERLGLQASRRRAYTRPSPAAMAALGPLWTGESR
ncbi:MAG TPA: aspartate/glutamate racemase family protein [Variovorax sp.]